MRTVLKIHEECILNLLELKACFDPCEVCEQLETFAVFAEVHSVPLQLMAGDQPAGVLTKAFWRDLLRACMDGGVLTDNDQKAMNAVQALKKRFDAFLCEQTGAKSVDMIGKSRTFGTAPGEKDAAVVKQEKLNADIARGCYMEKLKHIRQKINAGGDGKAEARVLLLLAVCELAEADARKYAFSPNAQSDASEPTVEAFTAQKELKLKVSAQPYQFLYHDERTLAQGEKIRTVRLFAFGGNPNDEAVVELHSAKTGACVQRIALKRSQAVYVNAAGDRVIKFLPDESESADQMLMREHPGSGKIMVIGASGSSEIKAEHVTSFSTAGEKAGFLLIADGQVFTHYYHQFNDHKNRHIMSTIPCEAVEVKVGAKGYAILGSNGRIYSNYIKPKSDQRFASLDGV